MRVLWSDDQEKVALPELGGLIVEVVEAVAKHLSVSANSEVSIAFVDDDEISHLNSVYRGKEGPTDVLSFPIGDDILDESGAPQGQMLGDVIISAERAVFQAAELGHSVEREFAFLLVHGLLHLLGYEHGDDMGAMGKMTEEVLVGIGLVR